MPRSQEQYEEIRKQKKMLIMETALELFAENGFHTTSMSRIAKKADVSKGLAYNYFQSKQDILDEILKTGFNSIYTHFDLNHDGVLTRDEFEHFIRTSFRVIGENRRFWKLYSTLIMQSDLADSFQKKYAKQSTAIMQTLSQFIASMGSSDPEGDLMAVSSLVKGAMLILISAPDVFPVKKLEDKITAACFKIISTNG